MEKQNYVIILRPAPAYADEGTERAIDEHFAKLQELNKSGEVKMAGRFSDVLIGLVIIQVDSYERAIEIMENDPAVKAGVFHAELYKWGVAVGSFK